MNKERKKKSLSSSSSLTSSLPSSSASPNLIQSKTIKSRFPHHYNPIKNPMLFSENIIGRKFARRKEREALKKRIKS
jgi:hypothetical protein